ncbi:hypothetical protein Vadar_013976 [Vaccinium darrowii]|uniref:Uncharacterized protein n=1 Tax=Vaccinium darrowii TaxID=229202 RepID=A0ACB7YLI6_9ERIC|nr:hypothetical protein Vadar_013976 [Vaccinium darrowii]
MTNNLPKGYADEFLEQILTMPPYSSLTGTDSGSSQSTESPLSFTTGGGMGLQHPFIPLGLSPASQKAPHLFRWLISASLNSLMLARFRLKVVGINFLGVQF